MKMIERVYGLYELLLEAIEEVSAFEAYMFVNKTAGFSLRQKDYMKISSWAITKSALMSCAVLFDRARYGKNDNCSFRQISTYINEVLQGQEKKKYECFIKRIEDLCKDFDDIFPSEIRNKLLAHKDLNKLFSRDIKPFRIEDIKRILADGYNIVSDIMDVTVGGHPKPLDFGEIIRKYKESLLSIADNENIV